jgi:putative oxidoreductase
MSPSVAQLRNYVLAWILRIALCAVFAYAGVEKWWGAREFVEQIANYQFLPELAPWAALLLPPIEIASAVALLLLPPVWRSASALLMFGMLLMFTVAMARAWSLGINIECGCFGKGSPTIGPLSFLRNGALMAAAATFIVLDVPRTA